jgi:hypothetical protein
VADEERQERPRAKRRVRERDAQPEGDQQEDDRRQRTSGERLAPREPGAARRSTRISSAGAASRRAATEIAELTGHHPESVISVERSDGGWQVAVEVVETHRIPDSADILVTYEVRLGPDGELLSYHRRERPRAAAPGAPVTSGVAPTGRASPANRQESANLADILERVLDKGIVIAGDIRVNLLDIELLTIKIRLLVASVDKAREIGIDWWEHDPSLSSGQRNLTEENRLLRERIGALEAAGTSDRVGGRAPDTALPTARGDADDD